VSYLLKIANYSCPLLFHALDGDNSFRISENALRVLKLESFAEQRQKLRDSSLHRKHRLDTIADCDGRTEK